LRLSALCPSSLALRPSFRRRPESSASDSERYLESAQRDTRYLHGLTDVIPVKIYLATKRNATRIKDNAIVQVFVEQHLFNPGRTQITYDGVAVSIYDKERMLVELLRRSASMPFDYYKELISSYRKIIGEMDFRKIEDYVALYKRGNHLFDALQREVL
jgi:predicted transcriptional regulator of viral defense system